MSTYLDIAQILVAVALIFTVLLQAKGSNLGGIFGASESSGYRTRRGIEKTLFQLTIVLSVLFVLISVANIRLAG
ncbi:MAG: preprotein translocase subunit SecG [Dehalococcoidia bacterium]|nr:preprotein translocase subunit SecG [Dehalococcoidia bacterium]